MFTYFKKSILSGICIGLGGAIFVKLGGIVGAIMFAFGLLTVIFYKLPLYSMLKLEQNLSVINFLLQPTTTF